MISLKRLKDYSSNQVGSLNKTSLISHVMTTDTYNMYNATASNASVLGVRAPVLLIIGGILMSLLFLDPQY